LDKTVPHALQRWLFTLLVALLYILRVYFLQVGTFLFFFYNFHYSLIYVLVQLKQYCLHFFKLFWTFSQVS